jgi:hypothetical protein
VERLPDPPGEAPARLVELLERYLAVHGVQVAAPLVPDLRRRAVWLVGSVVEADPSVRQRLLESGDAGLAEALLAEALARQGGTGGLSQMRARPPSPN